MGVEVMLHVKELGQIRNSERFRRNRELFRPEQGDFLADQGQERSFQIAPATGESGEEAGVDRRDRESKGPPLRVVRRGNGASQKFVLNRDNISKSLPARAS